MAGGLGGWAGLAGGWWLAGWWLAGWLLAAKVGKSVSIYVCVITKVARPTILPARDESDPHQTL